MLHVLLLGHTIGNDYLVKITVVDAINSVAAEDAVSDQRVNHSGAFFLQQSGCACNGVGGVGEIVDQDGRSVSDVAYKHHGCVLAIRDARWTPFLALLDGDALSTAKYHKPCGSAQMACRDCQL